MTTSLHRGRAVLGTVLMSLALPLMLLVALALIPLGHRLSGRRRFGYEVGRRIMRVCWRLLGIRLEQVHRERIEPSRPRVYMPNHESLLDMPQVMSVIPGTAGTLIKEEAFRVPLVGSAFRACGFIPVNRKSPRAARRAFLSAVAEARAGRSFVVAPEGTRSRTGELGPFKTGGFRIAMEARIPVVPITVEGAGALMRPGSWLIHPGVVRITWNEPVETSHLDPKDRAQLADLMRSVRQTMEAGKA